MLGEHLKSLKIEPKASDLQALVLYTILSHIILTKDMIFFDLDVFILTAKFVVSRCAYRKLRRDFGFFLSRQSFSEGGVNANLNVACSPSLAEIRE